MNNEEILEGNKLIAEFMGIIYDKSYPCMNVFIDGDDLDPTYFYCEWHPEFKLEGTNIIAWEFSPHKNWCQLMPVVEKISQTHTVNIHAYPCNGFDVRFNEGNYRIGYGEADSAIEATWKAVVEFIKWQNQQSC